MKKDRFLWSAHRITERQKAGKARSIKGKQLKNSRNTVSRQHVAHHSSQRDKDYCELQNMEGTPEFTRGVLFIFCNFLYPQESEVLLKWRRWREMVENRRMKNVEKIDMM